MRPYGKPKARIRWSHAPAYTFPFTTIGSAKIGQPNTWLAQTCAPVFASNASTWLPSPSP
jgi:hypothetical protein